MASSEAVWAMLCMQTEPSAAAGWWPLTVRKAHAGHLNTAMSRSFSGCKCKCSALNSALVWHCHHLDCVLSFVQAIHTPLHLSRGDPHTKQVHIHKHVMVAARVTLSSAPGPCGHATPSPCTTQGLSGLLSFLPASLQHGEGVNPPIHLSKRCMTIPPTAPIPTSSQQGPAVAPTLLVVASN